MKRYFMGTMKGNRRKMVQVGGKKSGLYVTAEGWNYGVIVKCEYDPFTDQNHYTILETTGRAGARNTKVLHTFQEKIERESVPTPIGRRGRKPKVKEIKLQEKEPATLTEAQQLEQEIKEKQEKLEKLKVAK